MNVGIIILAAGAASRMGRSKLDLPINGKTLLEHVIHQATQSDATEVVVVKGPHPIPPSAQSFKAIVNDNWERGIGSSIKTGLKFLLANHPSIDGALFLVADQPYIDSSHLNNLIREFNNSYAIVASHYNKTAGVPALFPKSLFADIESLRDEQGAKAIIEKNQGRVVLVEFPNGGIDLDTPEDYETFIEGGR